MMMMMSRWQMMILLLVFQFMANLEQCRSQVPGAWSVIFTFSLIVSFYLTKTGNRTKVYGFLQKMLTSAKLRGFWYYKVCFLKLHICV